ncbi:TIL domain-containing protein [Caenorhabditis elegans]|uniref:TIL domain-containing protein n=1 Tax=Caenorhabditis elegans TaxID=6239 RepID=Q18156_CAEEL|nr:TIL domain-containing protein [Caenorhabditis elegans]CCD65652.2 TIL domain-containing protein [Caenorhabditis elegans]|eukprot:NP_505344.2 Uncharacterized protein CELE_C25E10.7 [Caenorhabditis elegans]
MKTFLFLSFYLSMGSATQWITPGAPFLPECGKNQKRVACGYDCEPQCGFDPTVCSLECKPNACVCKDGYVRNTKNDCVRRLECTAETSRCPEDEVFQTCGTLCQPTCDDPYPTSCEHDRCIRNVCRCLPGLVRNSGTCTSLDECDNSPARPLELFTL